MARKKIENLLPMIATFDTETDPFEYGQRIAPFTCGFYWSEGYEEWWGKNCVQQFVERLSIIESPLVIYVHNGGKFDFFFMLEWFGGDIKIVNGRIILARIGIHEFRDSYAAFPLALSKYKKDDFDYNKMHRRVREQYKKEILFYQRKDCEYLHELMVGFLTEFGDSLTIGGAAIKQLKNFHEFSGGKEDFDAEFRQFYYGGRNQCFESGILKGNFKMYDVHSMYPGEMKNKLHPISSRYAMETDINEHTTFAIIEGQSRGALPLRQCNGAGTPLGLSFDYHQGQFFATGHEIRAGLETGTLDITRVVRAYRFLDCISFAEFVDHFYEKRLTAKAEGDNMRLLFYKLILNSAYGKFATDPTDFCDYQITPDTEFLGDGWMPEHMGPGYIIWSKPNEEFRFYNIATAASITGAARSTLLRGIAASSRPLYCDTDSILCESFYGDVDDSRLGSWGFEGECDTAAIAGKKLYALFKDGKCIKQASKGSRLTADEILRVARGEVVVYNNPVPAFKFNGGQEFIPRSIKMTTRKPTLEEAMDYVAAGGDLDAYGHE